MENFEKCTVAMLGGPCSQHVTGNTSWQNQPQSAIILIQWQTWYTAPICNLSHYFIGFICALAFIFNSHIPVHTPVLIILSCYQWSNRSMSYILFLKRCLHLNTRKFYRTIPIYMLDSWCRMYHLYLILFTFLGPVVYGLLFPKDKTILFYKFHVLYDNLIFIWIPCTNSVVLIGILTSYIYLEFIFASVCVSVRVCACV